MKPLLSDTIKSSEKILLVEGDEKISEDEKNTKILNIFFYSAVKNLKIEELSETDPFTSNINHPTSKPIIRCSKLPCHLSHQK